MLDFVKNAFRNGINVILWVNLMLSAIVGAIAGSFISSGFTFPGLIIGSICGLLTNILGGGFITTILSIERNTEEQTALLKKHLGISSFPVDNCNEDKNNGYEKKEGVFEDDKVSSQKNETLGVVYDKWNKWVCEKCGTINDIYVPVCKKCGEEMNKETMENT